jgi:hypothetical protein
MKLPPTVAGYAAGSILNIQQSDILHVRIGATAVDMGGSPYIPDEDILKEVRDAFEHTFPGNKILVTSHMVTVDIIRAEGLTNG